VEKCASDQGKTGVGFAKFDRSIEPRHTRPTGGRRPDSDRLTVVEMKEYEILLDTGTARKLVKQINHMAKEGWQAKSVGAGIQGVYVLMEREVG